MKAWMGMVLLAGALANGTVLAADVEGGMKFFKSCRGLLNYWNGKPVEANYDAAAMGYCVGVVHGVRASLQYLEGWLKNDHAKVCLPASYEEAMGVQAVVKFLDDHPDEVKKDAALITMLALKSEYPCR